MNIEVKTLRDLEIKETLKKLGLEEDPQDARQFKTDGFRISTNGQKWYDHTNSKGGGGSIDLVCHVMNLDFKSSVEFLNNGYTVTHSRSAKKADIKAASIVPIEYPKHWKRTRDYLIKDRFLNPVMVDWCADHQLIYADRYNNACFKYGSGIEMRGIYKKWRSCRGRLTKPFLLHCSAAPKALVITESAIDCLSYRQLNTGYMVASIAGNGNKNLMSECVDIAQRYSVTLISAFDNDEGGGIAHAQLVDLSMQAGINVERHTPEGGKDWNEQLELSLASRLSFPQ